MQDLFKYPRTRHVEGSGLQKGDEDLNVVPFADLRGKNLVVEDKIDGANCAISFTSDGELRLQSRGHYLTGGPREREFAPLKTWAAALAPMLWDCIGDQYVVYGEWMYAKHSVFYDQLPHFFMEFDVLDVSASEGLGKEEWVFLSTGERKALLEDLPIHHVLVLREGEFDSLDELLSLVGPCPFKSHNWMHSLKTVCEQEGLDFQKVLSQTDASDLMEGLYIKHEEDGRVVGRYKYVRAGFTQMVADSDEHWHERPICPNVLKPGANMYEF